MHVLAFYRNISFKGHTFRVAKYKGLLDNDEIKFVMGIHSFLPPHRISHTITNRISVLSY